MQPYDERLTAPPLWWLIPAAVALTGGAIVLPLGTGAALAGVAVGAVLASAAVSAYGSARIRVVQGSLVAGQARIPVSALGRAEVLEPEQAVAWRSYRADPRAFMLLRAYVPTAVRIEVVDPADPTPYLYLSTRRPQALVAALEAARV